MHLLNLYKHLIIAKTKLRLKLNLLVKKGGKFAFADYDIVHFITGDKFTAGYILFMQSYFCDKRHLFVTTPSMHADNYKNMRDTILCSSFALALVRKDILRVCNRAESVIWSGMFDKVAILLAPNSLINKSYFQFWGGDFYCYRKKSSSMTEKCLHKSFLEKSEIARGLIFLIYGEEYVFKKICRVQNKRCFVAPMPAKPQKLLEIKDKIKHIKKYRITIGNSSTVENNHLEVFSKMKHINFDDVEIFCPLSYGDMAYKEKVKEFAKEIFGATFHSLEQFMGFDDYIQYLADCDVGVFNNNRQQAMGNINYLLMLGKKVYINKETSMWQHYKKIGCTMFDINKLSEQNKEEILYIPKEMAIRNRDAILAYISDKNAVEQWRCIYE